jgi:hypothetical protein
VKSALDHNAPGPYARVLATRAGRFVVTVFFAWYVVAIGVYAIPNDTQFSAAQWLRHTIQPWTSPSVLMASQWQQWNLFSPDPLRRVTTYAVEVFRDGAWQPLVHIQPSAFPFWRHANHFKLLINVMEGSNTQVAERYVQSLCGTFGLEPGMELKVTNMVTVIPYLEVPKSTRWWREWDMMYSPSGGFATFCPDEPVTPLFL